MKAAVRLQQEDFSQDEEIAALRAGSNRMGGIATFIGCARDFSEGREVSRISFEAYGSMAVAEMNKLRVGVVGAGEQIVFIAAGAEHRAPALQACQWLIDKLKQRVPIWKKEITPQGEEWVTQHP